MRLTGMGLILITGWILVPLQEGYAESPQVSSNSLDQAIESVSTPKEVAHFMKKVFTFTEDEKLFRGTDYWQSPEEFWKRRRGDCEDFALFVQYILRKHGVKGDVVSIYGANGYAHTVFIFQKEGRYDVINEDRFYPYKAKSLEEAVRRVYPYWTWAAIAERRNGRGGSLRTITNPSPSEPPFEGLL